MAHLSGAMLLQAVADRIIIRYLQQVGYTDARVSNARSESHIETDVDATYRVQGAYRRIKIKADAYFGLDPAKVRDRNLIFYRSEEGRYAFESISNHITRESGWMFSSEAEELFYYYLALGQSEEEIQALLGEPDDIFFGELQVDRDELRILPMPQTRAWFEEQYEEYAPRPVMIGDHSAWYRLIPQSDIDAAVQGIKIVGPVFAIAAR